MAKPPPSGPHSDIQGVNMDARVGVPSREPRQGSAEELEEADAQSVGQPDEGETTHGADRSDG